MKKVLLLLLAAAIGQSFCSEAEIQYSKKIKGNDIILSSCWGTKDPIITSTTMAIRACSGFFYSGWISSMQNSMPMDPHTAESTYKDLREKYKEQEEEKKAWAAAYELINSLTK